MIRFPTKFIHLSPPGQAAGIRGNVLLLYYSDESGQWWPREAPYDPTSQVPSQELRAPCETSSPNYLQISWCPGITLPWECSPHTYGRVGRTSSTWVSSSPSLLLQDRGREALEKDRGFWWGLPYAGQGYRPLALEMNIEIICSYFQGSHCLLGKMDP